MANFIIRYKVIETTLGGAARKNYMTSVLIQANTEDEAKQIVSDCYVDSPEVSYEINFL